jgi:hypothetical protein
MKLAEMERPPYATSSSSSAALMLRVGIAGSAPRSSDVRKSDGREPTVPTRRTLRAAAGESQDVKRME